MTHAQGISRAEQGISGVSLRFEIFGRRAANGVNACKARDLESGSDRRYFAQPREAFCGPRDVREFREDRRRGIHRDVSQPRQRNTQPVAGFCRRILCAINWNSFERLGNVVAVTVFASSGYELLELLLPS